MKSKNQNVTVGNIGKVMIGFETYGCGTCGFLNARRPFYHGLAPTASAVHPPEGERLSTCHLNSAMLGVGDTQCLLNELMLSICRNISQSSVDLLLCKEIHRVTQSFLKKNITYGCNE